MCSSSCYKPKSVLPSKFWKSSRGKRCALGDRDVAESSHLIHLEVFVRVEHQDLVEHTGSLTPLLAVSQIIERQRAIAGRGKRRSQVLEHDLRVDVPIHVSLFFFSTGFLDVHFDVNIVRFYKASVTTETIVVISVVKVHREGCGVLVGVLGVLAAAFDRLWTRPAHRAGLSVCIIELATDITRHQSSTQTSF